MKASHELAMLCASCLEANPGGVGAYPLATMSPTSQGDAQPLAGRGLKAYRVAPSQ